MDKMVLDSVVTRTRIVVTTNLGPERARMLAELENRGDVFIHLVTDRGGGVSEYSWRRR